MPLNVRRFYSSLLIVLGIFLAANAQTVPPAPSPAAQPQTTVPVAKMPTAAEVMRDRISKAKAFIAVRNYNAANYELETIRRESADSSVLSVVNVLLMNSYLEQGDYKRAQDFLNESFNIQKTTKPGAAANYFAVAGQIVKGARTRVERYRALGLNPSDRTLPLEAINDLEKMRETVEIVVTQSKEISKEKVKTADAMALLEEASVSRSMMARDDYDARKWQTEVADAREDLASSRSVVRSAINDAPAASLPASSAALNKTVAQADPAAVITNTGFSQPVSTPVSNQPLVKPTVSSQPINQPPRIDQVPQNSTANQQLDRNRVISEQPVTQTPVQNNSANTQPVSRPASQPATPSTSSPETSGPSDETNLPSGPLDVGSLIAFATAKTQPMYPSSARAMRQAGIVKVDVVIDENGNVVEVQGVTGPALLQGAARDAVRKWRFKPFVRDGQPVRATGFVSFNFSL